MQEELAEQMAKNRADLKDQPLEKGEVLFVDGSSKKDKRGKTQTGYAVVTQTTVIKAEPSYREVCSDAKVNLDNFTILRADRMKDSGKERGGGVCMCTSTTGSVPTSRSTVRSGACFRKQV